MNNAGVQGSPARPPAGETVRAAEQLVQQVHDELRLLLQQRAEIMKRIGTAKKTLSGLASLFGDSVVVGEVMRLVDGGPARRRPGFTRTCRTILMEADHALTAHEMRDRIQERAPALLERQKDPISSITTILNRLVEYGEAQRVSSRHSGRAWQWIADASDNNASQGNRAP